MKFLFCLLCITCFTQLLPAQTLRTFKGKVLDSATHNPLPDATISIYRATDTLLINFGFTTPNGNFSLSVKTTDSLIIIVSILGYNEKTIKKPMEEGWNFEELDVKLSQIPLEFRGFTVRSSAIRMNGDTIEINAGKFKVLPGSDVAQLFKKIPGFEVSVKGEIKVNGDKVTKIMVDGSDFFGNNPGMVSKNLSADMIETVQVFEEKNEDGSPKEEKTKIINLKLKKGKRNGVFGDFLAGAGTQERYEGGLRINNFKNDRKLSVIANANNTNGTGFDFGFENWHDVNTVSRNGSGSNEEYFYRSSRNYMNGNINNEFSSGLSYFNEFKKSRKLSVSAFVNTNRFFSLNTSRSINPLNDSITRTNLDSSVENGFYKSANININYTKEYDSTGLFDIGITGFGGNTKQTGSSINRITLNNEVANEGSSDVKSIRDESTFNISSSYRRNLRKDKRYSFFIAGDYKDANVKNQSYQFLRSDLDTFNNLNSFNSVIQDLLFKVWLQAPLTKKKLYINLSADRWFQKNNSRQLSTSAQNQYSGTFEQTYNKQIDSMTRNFNNTQEQYSIKPFITYSHKKMYSVLGTTFLNLNLVNLNEDGSPIISKQYNKVLPYFNFYYYPDNMYASANISRSSVFPTINELQPILNISNNFERYIGNPDLKPQDESKYSIYASLRKLKYLRYLSFNSRGSYSDNAKIISSRLGSDGIIIKTPVNSPGLRTISHYIYTGKKITKLISIDVGGTHNYEKRPVIVNSEKAFSLSNSWRINPSLSINKSDSLDLSFGMEINTQNYKNTFNNSLDFFQITKAYTGNIRSVLKWGTEINSTLNINDQRNVPGIGRIVPLWNAYIQQPLGKNAKFNLKLTAYDILKQNTNISRRANDNFIIISQNNQLQQYFMLTLIYKIKKMGSDDEPNYTY